MSSIPPIFTGDPGTNSSCLDVNWNTISYLAVSGSAVALVWILLGIILQLYHCRFVQEKPLQVRIQVHALLTCLLTFSVFIVVSVRRDSEDFFSTASCIGVGSVFYALLLSSFMWLATEPVVALACARNINSVQQKYTGIMTVTCSINYGLPFLLMLILHLASNVSTPLYGNALHVSDDTAEIPRQICWIRNGSAMIVAMLAPAVLSILISTVAGTWAHVLYTRAQCDDLHYPPTRRLILAPAYGVLWIVAGLGNGQVQVKTGCDSSLALNITFCALAVLVMLLICLEFNHAASVLSQVPEHEKLAARSLVFIKQLPILLGSDGPSSPSISQMSGMTQMTTLSTSNNTAFPALVQNNKRPQKNSRQAGSFDDVVSALPTLPAAFTLKPGGTKAEPLASTSGHSSTGTLPRVSVSPPDASHVDQMQPSNVDGTRNQGSTGNMSLAEAVLDKSRSAVDMTRGLQLDDPLRSGSSMPNIGHILKVEKELRLQSPVPQAVEEVLVESDQQTGEDNYSKQNVSFDELDSDGEDPGKAQLPYRTSPAGTLQSTIDSDRKANDPDGESQSMHEETEKQPGPVTRKPSRSRSLRKSKTLPESRSGSVADDERRTSTLPPSLIGGAEDESFRATSARKTSSFMKYAGGKRGLPRENSWQSSERDSSEMDTLPKTKSLPGHKKHKPDGQETPANPGRPKRGSARKSLQEDTEEVGSPESYLEAHSQAVALSSIDEQAATVAQPKKQRQRSNTVGNGLAGPAARPVVKAGSEGNLLTIDTSEAAVPKRAQSTKNIAGEPRKQSSSKQPKSPPPSQDPRYWYQAGYGGGHPYGPGYNPYQYPQYPAPGYGQPYDPYYGTPYAGGMPYGYPGSGYYGQPPMSARQAKLSKKQGRSPAPTSPPPPHSAVAEALYAEVAPTNKKGHNVRFPHQ